VARELERQGYVDRLTGESDRRQIFLQLTPKALAFVKQYLPKRRAQLKSLFSNFEPGEIDELERLLRKLLPHVD
jgi:MarR family transcriptional repressor of emrRAB